MRRTPGLRRWYDGLGCARPFWRYLGMTLFVVGLVLLVAGAVLRSVWLVDSGPVASVLGFLVMFGGVVLMVSSSAGGQADPTGRQPGRGRFIRPVRERFRRPSDQD